MNGSESTIPRTFLRRFSEPRTQPSLFNYIKTEPEEGFWAKVDWNTLKHPIRTFKEGWKAPHTRASLFHYIEEEEKQPFSWKEFVKDIFTSGRLPLFIPSVFVDTEELALERAQMRTRRMESGMLSIVVHLALIGFFIFIVRITPAAAPQDNMVF